MYFSVFLNKDDDDDDEPLNGTSTAVSPPPPPPAVSLTNVSCMPTTTSGYEICDMQAIPESRGPNTSSDSTLNIRLSVLGKELTPVHVVKDLGVTFDSSLTFQEHIVKTVSSCFSSLAQINRVKYVFDRSTLITIINTLVFSKLFYCSSVWSSAAATNLLKLQAVQNFAARIICGSRKFDRVTPLLKELHWLPIKSQLYLRDAVLAFKCMTGSAPTYLSSKFLTRGEVSGRATRNPQLLHIPLYKSN